MNIRTKVFLLLFFQKKKILASFLFLPRPGQLRFLVLFSRTEKSYFL